MRNAKLKYAGLIIAIIGIIILLFIGSIYRFHEVSDWFNFDMDDFTIPAIISVFLIIFGILAYVFIEE